MYRVFIWLISHFYDGSKFGESGIQFGWFAILLMLLILHVHFVKEHETV